MKKKQIVSRIAGILLSLIPGMVFLLIPSILTNCRDLSESYSRYIFPWISRLLIFLTGMVPVSLTEIFIVSIALTWVFWLILLIYRFIRSDHKAEFVYK